MRRVVFFLIGMAMVAALGFARLLDPAPVQGLREIYFDYLQRIAPRQDADLPVKVVDIDEESLERLGQWPWPRTMMADLIDRLAGYGVAVIAFDVLFPEPDRMSPSRLLIDPRYRAITDPSVSGALAGMNNDLIFADAMRTFPVVLGRAETVGASASVSYSKAGIAELGESPTSGLPVFRGLTRIVPVLETAAAGEGSVSVSPEEASNIVRVVPLMWKGEGGVLPALSIEALRVAMGETTYRVTGVTGVSGVVQSVGIGEFEVPTNSRGEIWVRYRPDDPSLYVSAADVLDKADDPGLRAQLEGHIVLVGTSAVGLLDIRSTPLGQNVPGVSIHAQIIEQILAGTYLTRSDLTEALELAAFLCLCALVTALMSLAGPLSSMVAGGVASSLTLGFSYYLFAYKGILFDATFPLAGGLAVYTVLAGYQFVIADREKRLIRRSFSHYVAPEVLGEIERSGHKLDLGGEIRTVTVLFCDIVGFTPLSESMAAKQLVSVLNGLFTRLTDEILTEKGTIDKFIGDAIMAFWNAPIDNPHHRAAGCRAALGIRKSLLAFNEERERAGNAPIRLAVGLASGQACVGNIGSRQRYNYSALGETVNVASRIETSCRYVAYDVVVPTELAEASGGLAWLPAGRVGLKGVSGRIPVAVLAGDVAMAASPAFRRLSEAHGRLIASLSQGTKSEDLAAECRSLAAAVEPGLASFYNRIGTRAADFAPAPAPANLSTNAPAAGPVQATAHQAAIAR
ncbi:MAG: CHASE2 domain-containing protein [Paracoccaceae bacterium]